MEADYCVIGAGAAGCVLADRLTESGRSQVVLVEAGPTDWHPYIHIPATFLFASRDPRFNWGFKLEPDPGINGRALEIPQGKVLGGSSSVNAQIFVRGQPAEYDRWAAMGCAGWAYDDVLPFYRRMEDFAGGTDAYRGRSGPMHVIEPLDIHPLTRAFMAATSTLGFARNPDLNGPTRDGVGLAQANRKGRFRSGSAQTYLRRAKRRQNLRIELNALATRVLFEGQRAVGAEFLRDGRKFSVRARREVILSAGALKSPHLLMLSGIGDPVELGTHGIPVVAASPLVGKTLCDHFHGRMVHRVAGIETINERTRGIGFAKELVKYVLFGRGILTGATTSAVLFHRSRPNLAGPDLYISFIPGSHERPGRLERQPGMSVSVVQSYPESRGFVALKSSDPREHPAISPRYLSAPEDGQAMAAGLRLARRLFATPELSRWSAGEVRPGSALESDDELLGFARQFGTHGAHFTSSCAMGAGSDAVVSPDLTVNGVSGLRVVDASIMPTATSGNSHAPTVMIGEKGADLILAS